MPKLTDDQINEFKRITKKVFGRTLSDAEALALAHRFLVCLELMARRKKPAEPTQ